jgi:hypothetical protein
VLARLELLLRRGAVGSMLRTLPSALLLQFLIGPVLLHLLLRQAKIASAGENHRFTDNSYTG